MTALPCLNYSMKCKGEKNHLFTTVSRKSKYYLNRKKVQLHSINLVTAYRIRSLVSPWQGCDQVKLPMGEVVLDTQDALRIWRGVSSRKTEEQVRPGQALIKIPRHRFLEKHLNQLCFEGYHNLEFRFSINY